MDLNLRQVTRRIRFGHVTLILALFAAVVTYYQASDGLSTASATLYVFFWTVLATWVSVEFYKGDLLDEKEELKKWNEDWRATVVDFREENEELKRENDELRETIKELSRENYELKQEIEGEEAESEGVEAESGARD
ncbi:MAG: hypothetical protein SV760_00635 [Halobacteria archaeon]|nr:hypothetical protein [Halobacteria archaeon]